VRLNWLQKLLPEPLGRQKKRAYHAMGWEYLVWQVFDQQIDWFSLQNADYMTLLPE